MLRRDRSHCCRDNSIERTNCASIGHGLPVPTYAHENGTIRSTILPLSLPMQMAVSFSDTTGPA